MKISLKSVSQDLESVLSETLKNIEFSSFTVGVTGKEEEKFEIREKITSFIKKNFKTFFFY